MGIIVSLDCPQSTLTYYRRVSRVFLRKIRYLFLLNIARCFLSEIIIMLLITAVFPSSPSGIITAIHLFRPNLKGTTAVSSFLLGLAFSMFSNIFFAMLSMPYFLPNLTYPLRIACFVQISLITVMPPQYNLYCIQHRFINQFYKP